MTDRDKAIMYWQIELMQIDKLLWEARRTPDRQALLADIDRALESRGYPVEPSKPRMSVEELRAWVAELNEQRAAIVERLKEAQLADG